MNECVLFHMTQLIFRRKKNNSWRSSKHS